MSTTEVTEVTDQYSPLSREEAADLDLTKYEALEYAEKKVAQLKIDLFHWEITVAERRRMLLQ